MDGRPLCVDLYCGLGGGTEGFLAEGYRCVGFDIEQHVYGEQRYPGQLVIQDVLTIHGSQFRDAACIVASPPCQEFSYMAMPWTRAKDKARALRAGPAEDRARLTALFDACFRIQREASKSAGRHIPLVVENVCGAQKWVGTAKWHFGSYYLWGDVPALMPLPHKAFKTTGLNWSNYEGTPGYVGGQAFNDTAVRATKNTGGSWFNIAHNTTSGHGQNPDGRKTIGHVNKRDGHSHTRHLTNQAESDAVKVPGFTGAAWFDETGRSSSKSSARKAASARIAKIPYALANHIARCFHPGPLAESA